MNSLVLLIPLSILFLVGAGVALFWAVDHGQFEDTDTAALLPLVDADARPSANQANGKPPGETGETTRSSV